ncbi:MAG: hypothetical protein ACXVZ2_09470 [Gaiellaceae bacterium]
MDVLAQVDGAHRPASEQTLDPEAGEHTPDLDLDRQWVAPPAPQVGESTP